MTGSPARWPRALLALAALVVAALAVPASAGDAPTPASPPPSQPPPPAPPLPLNVARLVLGGGAGSAGWGCHEAMSQDPYYQCSRWSYGAYIPLVVGLGLDLSLGGPSFLGLGVNALTGKLSYDLSDFANGSTRLTVWEATADYVHKFGSADQATRGRVRAGVGGYVGGGEVGGALRIGGGATFRNHRRLGIGLDMVVEGGVYAGYWTSTVYLLVSPELRF